MHLARLFGGGQARHVETHHQAWQLGFQVQGEASLARCGQLTRRFGGGHGALGDGAKVALNKDLHLGDADITHHHQGGVVRCVPGLIPGAQLLDGHAIEVGHPADGGRVVTTGGVGHGLEALVGQARRFVVGAQAALFLDHLDFLGKLIGRQLEAGQAVGFQLQGNGQAVAGQHLVVGGVIVAGKGVFLGTQFTQDARGFAGAELAAALEHHVFEGVGQAGLAGRLVAGANLVPELADHHWCAMIFAHDDLEAIVQAEFVGRLGFCGEGQQGCAEHAEQQGCSALGNHMHGLSTCRTGPLGLSVGGRGGARIRIRFTGDHAC